MMQQPDEPAEWLQRPDDGRRTGTAVNGTMSGKVFNGAMSQGTVTAYAVNNGTLGAQIASTATDARVSSPCRSAPMPGP